MMADGAFSASDSPSDPTPGDTPASSRPLILQSAELLQGRREVWIEHGEDMYRLRITANGKLYLTK